MEDVLGQGSLSRRALERRFKQCLGRTPNQEIQRRRMDRVRELLARSDVSIAAIAHSVGLGTSEYLAAMFRRHEGCTPTEYRRQFERRGV